MSDGRPNFPEREKEILAFWEKNDIFNKSLKKKAPKGSFVFFEGPPTANGKPGIHHAEARAFKDLIPRFRTMQGYRVDRKAGWDTHGLPVELEVEKQLGFKSKIEIEEFGVGPFNQKCKESVWKYLEVWKEFTRRIGFWVDLENAYVTYKPEYVESLWWIIKQVWDKGLLYQDYRVTPHCPRCGTSLSSHELAQEYKDVKDISVYAKFKVAGKDNEYFVAWTTTPWTLPANVALAVGEKIQYVKVEKTVGQELPGAEGHQEYYWLAKSRVEASGLEGSKIVEECEGSKLVGMEYEPLYPFVREAIKGTDQEGKKGWYVAAADFVTTTDGTGIVHTAVMYGADDFELGTKIGLPKYHLVKLDGTFVAGTDFLAGRLVTEEAVAVDIIKDLAHRGLLYRKEKFEHSYPHCWRCKSKVIYYAKDSWYIRMSELRDELIAQNATINWEPAHLKEGRFGEWLREVKDWAFSRERYWGTPLPIWICQECGEKTCIGSFEELREKALSPLPAISPPARGGVGGGGREGGFDPHRPFVDEIELKCGKCGGTSLRVPDVCDVWFDSGAMPFAQWHYPFENKEKIDPSTSSGQVSAYPADYISEAIDQTRGWFYTMLAVSTLLGKPAAYKNVICLGHLLDAKGKKMSKSQGNIVEPMEMIEKYGADSVRWYLYTVNQPGESKRFEEKALSEMQRAVFGILGNVAAFYETYADGKVKEVAQKNLGVLDAWILTRLDQTIEEVTAGLEAYRITEPARLIGSFINDLSTWWLRRSRDRFKSEDEADTDQALSVLRECLLTTAKLLAPFAPFFAEDLYGRVTGDKDSVHLEDWPVKRQSVDATVVSDMAQTRSIVSRCLERRAEAGKNVRQVLASAIVTLPSGSLGEEYIKLIQDEVNVKAVTVKKGEYAVELDLTMTPELVREGTVREIIRRINGMRKDAKLTIEDRIALFVNSAEPEVVTAVSEHRDALLSGTLATALNTDGEQPENSETFRVNEFDITVGFTKAEPGLEPGHPLEAHKD